MILTQTARTLLKTALIVSLIAIIVVPTVMFVASKPESLRMFIYFVAMVVIAIIGSASLFWLLDTNKRSPFRSVRYISSDCHKEFTELFKKADTNIFVLLEKSAELVVLLETICKSRFHLNDGHIANLKGYMEGEIVERFSIMTFNSSYAPKMVVELSAKVKAGFGKASMSTKHLNTRILMELQRKMARFYADPKNSIEEIEEMIAWVENTEYGPDIKETTERLRTALSKRKQSLATQ